MPRWALCGESQILMTAEDAEGRGGDPMGGWAVSDTFASSYWA